ncbi:hypothetical protein NsoK4_03780 [Nitrosopumilus sp. K4]|uniref:coiled-coil domain-containing protein n=1 Tax=Nitrosopumilus sp. K4 TaxID=2795383 RepID=UPI001BA7E7C1|nr:hypothetical protein [Nitrosopumilus sp. K4]QUC65374.1 hypothetical protein NsoK4_03780 [Nitrosopumilus sp. K4]
MTKTIIAIALAAIMVVGTLGFNPGVFAANGNANEASPANGGVSNGLPFTNLQEQIDAINAEIDTLTADNDANIAALQAQIDAINAEIDALSSDVEANADAIDALEEDVATLNSILGTDCGTNAIRAIQADGSVLCISVNEAETTARIIVSGPTVWVDDTGVSYPIKDTATATCPATWALSGGGFDGLVLGEFSHIGPHIQSSMASGNSWVVEARAFSDPASHGWEHFRAVAQCIKVF